ncbi:MAG: RluA family pseudouridine synthase [Acholeplasmataceae bacterium]|nr:RluA family pseudouridine synthase [Acholeplasmataceae bacterium]
MSKTTIKIDSEAVGQRLDQYLHTVFYTEKSRSYVQNAIKEGYVLVNNQKVKTGHTLKLTDLIEIEEIEAKKLDMKAVDMNLDVVYEDEDLLVVNKPQGMVVHPASSYHEPTLVHGLLHQVEELSSINGIIRPGIVHRIDKDTSGLLVVAKSDKAHQILSEDLKDHDIARDYIALVYGRFEENEGTINAPIMRHPKNRLKMAVLADGKHAITHFKVIERFEKYTLLSCKLETGRTHQIRVHLSYIHHPIVGDPIYGPREVVGSTGQFLHAEKLSFVHPIKKEQMTFTADMPQVFKDFLSKLREDSVS